MSVLESHVDAASAEFRENAASMERLVADLRERLARGARRRRRRGRAAGTASRASCSCASGSSKLLDPGTPFLEIGALAAHGLYEGQAPAAGLVCGIGRVSGREVMIVANDATVKGGTYFPVTVQEAPARAGDRTREPAALPVPGRLGRGVPAAAGRGVPGPRPLRPHLLQPGAHERRGPARR